MTTSMMELWSVVNRLCYIADFWAVIHMFPLCIIALMKSLDQINLAVLSDILFHVTAFKLQFVLVTLASKSE